MKILLFQVIFFICSYCTAQNSNLLAKWEFKGNGNDTSGNSNHLVVNNTILTKDRFNIENNAYYFNGKDSNLVASVSNLPVGNSKRSITGWFLCDFNAFEKYDVLDFTLFDYGDFNNRGRVAMSLYQKGYIQLSYDKDNFIYDSNNSYNDNRWHFFALTYDGSELRTYIDDKLIFNVKYDLNTSSNNSKFNIGKNINDKDFFLGSIDDISIYNEALNESEIKLLFKSQNLSSLQPILESKIKIYSNVFFDNLIIENGYLENINVVFYNSLGQRIDEKKLKAFKNEINLSHLNKGVYIIQFILNDKIVKTHKILKK
ncbi:T9SS type A sorting domain-containing protein [Empedobacter falsenii]|uniref:LamG-like jellyroll fold domain-containing protein n=1 Tax=Empedobacter falsenii TaxID=343874 RepID=UPI002574A137|nr:LamG-like jellyroll fold domain-containing protein [Empedobacter falsenii]MDM1299076.1 T9SS type A sorting domain-containing protein [Empedobacter falsenii]MDM1318989.1 T9SS type A sorting domain-containing protein [Empedobacter falsenii]